MDLLDKLRQTGRTTRLIKEAIRLEEEGRAVYIVLANSNEISRLKREHPILVEKNIKLETFHTLYGNKLDSRVIGTMPWSHPNCVVLIDHYAIENRFSNIINILHRFDAPDSQSKSISQLENYIREMDKKFAEQKEEIAKLNGIIEGSCQTHDDW